MLHYQIHWYNEGSTAKDVWITVPLDKYTYYVSSSYGSYDVDTHTVKWYLKDKKPDHYIIYFNLTIREDVVSNMLLRMYAEITYTCLNGFKLPPQKSNIVYVELEAYPQKSTLEQKIVHIIPVIVFILFLTIGIRKKLREEKKAKTILKEDRDIEVTIVK
jgi:hypothetical protein